MSRKLRIAYFAHTIRSDWNNGNAHFLRGLLRALGKLGHHVTAFEPAHEWSLENLLLEPVGERSLQRFADVYPDIRVQLYDSTTIPDAKSWIASLQDYDIVVLHEWNPPELARALLAARNELGWKLLFHDTHHRASSSPEQIERFGILQFDGVLAFGEALRTIYRERFGIECVWTLHEAADTSVFRPLPSIEQEDAIVWVGNWGDGERSHEIREFLLKPAAAVTDLAHTSIYGVRYPADGLSALSDAGVKYGGYLPNLDAPAVYAAARLTVHIPRQQYSSAMKGIPTIRVFEALACGIPLISAPWEDSESLFGPGDFLMASNGAEMIEAMRSLLGDREAAAEQAQRGRRTLLARHTCAHRAQQFTDICEGLLA